MSGNLIPRSSIHASQYSVVDYQLKSLKLLTRRLQSVSKILEAELLVLHRLFYKNKNQHRTALFWRNVSEIRRYSQRAVSLKLLDTLQSLRLLFHGSVTAQSPHIPTQKSSSSTRGSWTCLPSKSHLLNISASLDVARKLTERMSEACSRAYISFNRSLQSGAFLGLLLTFVAVSSRLRTISLELKDAYGQLASCISKFLVVHETFSKTPPEDTTIEGIHSIPDPFADDVDISTPEVIQPTMTTQALEATEAQQPRAVVISERKAPQKIKGKGDASKSKKKTRVTRNEIDDIFGS